MNLRPLHAQAALLASLTFACSSPDGDEGPTSGTESTSTSGSTSPGGESTASGGDETTAGQPQTSGATVGNGTSTEGGSTEGGSSEGTTMGTTGTTGGETITACGVDNPWLCEDFEGPDPLAAWQIIQAPGNELSVTAADSPAEPHVLRAHSSETANGNIALVRQLVQGAEGADVSEAGTWVNLSATCLPQSELSVLTMLLTDPVRRTPIVSAAVHLNEGGGYV